MQTKGKLTKAPLIYVLGVVKFPTIIGMNNYVEKIQQALRKEYLQYKPISINQLQIVGNQTIQATSQLWQFSDSENNWSIMLSQDQVALQTSNYDRFKDFSDRLEKIIKVISDIAEITHYGSLGLRYIDLVCPKKGEDLSEYIGDILFCNKLSVGVGTPIDGFSAASYKNEIGNIAIRCWMNPGDILPPDLAYASQFLKIASKKPTSHFAILDTDHMSESDKPTPFVSKEIIRKIDLMHVNCKKIFVGISSKHAMKTWK